MENKLLSVAEAAVALGAHPRSVRAMLKDGTLPAVSLGPRRTRIQQSDVDLLVASHKKVVSPYEIARQELADEVVDAQRFGKLSDTYKITTAVLVMESIDTNGMSSKATDALRNARENLKTVSWLRAEALEAFDAWGSSL